MHRAIVVVSILMIAAGAASADPKADLAACTSSAPDMAACDRVIGNAKETRDNLAAAHYARGTVLYNRADYKAALADFDRAIALKKDHDNAYYNRALALRMLDQPDRAISDLTVYIGRNPNEHQTYIERGSLYLDKRDFSRAQADYERALKLSPQSDAALVGLGKLLLELKEEKNALARFDEAIRINPSASNHLARGDANATMKRLDEAGADYDEAIKADPSNLPALTARAILHGQQQQYAAAIERYNQALRIAPDDADLLNGRGWILLETNDYQRAKADLDHALKINPQHGFALYNRGRALLELGLFDAALADLDAAERAKVDTTDVPFVRGWALTFKGDHARALTEFAKGAAQNPDQAGGFGGLCWAHAQRNEFDKAMPYCDRAIAIDPKDAENWHNRGVAKLLMSAHSLALADFDQTISLKPEAAAAYADRGRTYEARGERERAVADYQKAVTLRSRGYYDDIAKAEALKRLTALATASPQATTANAPQKPATPVAPEKRVALVIGNSAYTNVPALLNPRNDARAVAASLKRLGFAAVMEEYDLTRAGMTRALQKFGELADDSDWAVIYYAGHGIEIGGVNYAIPVDAALKAATHIEDEAVPQERVMATVGNAKKMRLVILDACRDNPFVPKMRTSGGTRSVGRGLARIDPPPGVLLAYAARDGLTAMDGETGNSPFASALVEFLEEPGLEINLLFRKVRDTVFRSTRGQQEPFTYGSLPAQQFFFRIAQP